MADHVHIPGDGRPGRVFVDGVEIKRAVYADTLLGIVRAHDDHPQINERRDGIIERELRGVVEFFPLG